MGEVCARLSYWANWVFLAVSVDKGCEGSALAAVGVIAAFGGTTGSAICLLSSFHSCGSFFCYNLVSPFYPVWRQIGLFTLLPFPSPSGVDRHHGFKFDLVHNNLGPDCKFG